MNKAILASAGVFIGTFGVLVGVNLVGSQASETTNPPAHIITVSTPSELPSPTPEESPTPSPSTSTSRATYVPPKTDAPDPENPQAGGGTGGGHAGGVPKVTGTPPMP